MATLEMRVQALEERAEVLEARLAASVAPPARSAGTAPAAREGAPHSRRGREDVLAGPEEAPAAATARTHEAPRAAAPVTPEALPVEAAGRPALEDLLGGRVLAWVGGVAVAIGVVLLLAIAARNGWIGEAARTVMAAVASTALLAIGAWLHERRVKTDAALAAAAAGTAGLFATLAVAGEVYALIPSLLALVLALGVGAVATVLAVRWDAPGFGALGIGGALVAPALVGADPADPRTLALVAVATASATGVLLRERWTWLAYATFACATPQWLVWLTTEERSAAAIVLVLTGFGALNLAAAAGFEVRSRAPGLRASAVFLLAFNALVLAVAGRFALADAVSPTAGHLWLAGLAAAHLGAGVAAGRTRRVSYELALVCTGLGVILADVAFGLLASGPVLVVGWAAAGAAFCAWVRRGGARAADAPFSAAGTGTHLALALGHVLITDAPPSALLGAGTDSAPAAALGLAALAAGCFASGRIAGGGRPDWRVALDAAGLAVLAYATAIPLHGAGLVLAWTLEAVALGGVARRERDTVATAGALAFLGLAAAYAVAALAPAAALLHGLEAPLAAAGGLLAVAAAAALLAVRSLPLPLPAPPPDPAPGAFVLTPALLRAGLVTAAALALLHLASTELVSLVELGSPQRAQTVLSGFWALCGVAALIAGLVRDVRGLRLGALALLGVTAGKVFLYDLASLTSLYRVASFIALGLLMLGGAFAWQRLRPRLQPSAAAPR
ncbi:MAG TPA: DUF2339 domain-containing protein [Solirubrobacteraceae bacterium]